MNNRYSKINSTDFKELSKEKCNFEDCKKKSSGFFQRKTYCIQHYTDFKTLAREKEKRKKKNEQKFKNINL